MSRAKGSAAPFLVYESAPLSSEDTVDTAKVIAETFARETSAPGICVADGLGLRIHVERGALVVEDGVGEHRRKRRFDKATHGLSRLVVIGTSGYLSLDALTWCRRLGVPVFVLAPDGAVSLASTPRMTDDARLRRQQALAPELPVGLDLARSLLSRKLTAQAQLVARRFDAHDAACAIVDLAEATESSSTIDELRGIEAAGASLYWQGWTGRPECVPRFAPKDTGRVPAHWLRYEGRRSVLASANGNRKAERPLNALLNYVYALLEAEAVLAAQVVGLDPGLGIVHNDARSRPSLALDLMEPVRPEVDSFVLDLFERRTFRKVEFTETPDGHCRLKAPLTHELAETIPQWSQSLAPIAEDAAHTLGQAMVGKYVPTTPLTTRKHRHAQSIVKARKAAVSSAATSTTPRQRPNRVSKETVWSCPDCGGPVRNPRHVRCESCITADPRQTPALRKSRGQAIAARKRAQQEWEEANPGVLYDPDYFRRRVLPGLKGVNLADIMEAAEISKGYASQVRAGKFTPHVSTWTKLLGIAANPTVDRRRAIRAEPSHREHDL